MDKTETNFNRKELLEKFKVKYQEQLTAQTRKVSVDDIKTTIVSDEEKYLEYLGKSIREGRLVAFPTQTVYGLGADATNKQALLNIYKVKRRPLTDPIIAHVLGYQEALPLVNFRNDYQKEIFKKLTEKFWPGPLTIILKANLDVLPLTITAQTGFVGIRSPKHPYARKLLQAAKKPIGAPSANLFSHVSPTSACHVFNDFYDQEINLVDSEQCEYGIQSTVIKIEGKKIEILREGSLQTTKLEDFINQNFNQESKVIQIEVITKVKDKSNNEGMQSPGQLLKHYAPYLPCYYTEIQSLKHSNLYKIRQSQQKDYDFSRSAVIILENLNSQENNQQQVTEIKKIKDKFKIILSIKTEVQEVKKEQLEEEEKFCSAEEKIKMKWLYYLLRKGENLDVEVILIVWKDKKGTIWDKIFRATQGNQAKIL